MRETPQRGSQLGSALAAGLIVLIIIGVIAAVVITTGAGISQTLGIENPSVILLLISVVLFLGLLSFLYYSFNKL